MQDLKLYFCLLFLTTNIFQAMEAPLEQGQIISALKDIQIRLSIQNLKKNEPLTVDSISPFDISPITLTRKNLGSLNNGLLSLNGEKLEFDSGDGKKTIVSAVHIYPEGKKDEGVAVKLSYNRASHNFDFHLDEVKKTELKRIGTESINLKQPTKNLIPSILLALDVNPSNWSSSKVKITQNQILNPVSTPINAGKTPSKNWQFWKK